MTSQRTNKPSAVEVLKLALVACLAVELLSPVVRGQEAADTAVAATAPQASTINFSRDVQPILASKCIRCHGPETHEAGLRLDDRKVAASELESGNHAIVPGQPDDSELLRRITADESERMPPEEPPLDATQVATLRQWIAEGATWPDHWAYQPLAAADAAAV